MWCKLGHGIGRSQSKIAVKTSHNKDVETIVIITLNIWKHIYCSIAKIQDKFHSLETLNII